MAIDLADLIRATETHARKLGIFDSVHTAEPKNAPGKGLRCVIWVAGMRGIASSGLNSTTVRVELGVRVMNDFQTEPVAELDGRMLNAVSALWAAYSAGFTLGGRVRLVDLLGGSGEPLAAEAGYMELDRRMFRVITISLPLVVNDQYDQSP